MREYLSSEQLKQFSFEKIERLQNKRFSATCRHILPQTPFYKELFNEFGIDPLNFRKVDDWRAFGLPLIKKAVYLKKAEQFIVNPPKKGIFFRHLSYLERAGENKEAIDLFFSKNKEKFVKDYYNPHSLIFSGGTETGTPSPVFFTKTQQDNLTEILKIIGEVLIKKYFPSERLVGMNLFPYAPHLGWHAVHKAIDINCDLNLNTAAGGAIPTERLLKIAQRAQPNVICGMADYLKNRFLPLAIERKIKLPERVVFISSAQAMLEIERERIMDLAHKCGVKEAIVLNLYAATELKEALLPELWPKSGFYHIAPLSTIIKTVEAKHTTQDFIDEWEFSGEKQEEGHAAIWNIDGAGTLFEGYILGDNYERMEKTTCPKTNFNTLRIVGVNRIRDIQASLKLTGTIEQKIKGTKINLISIREQALTIPEVLEAQVILKRKQNKIELKFTSNKPKKAKKQLESLFKDAEIRPTITHIKEFKQEGVKLNTVIIQ